MGKALSALHPDWDAREVPCVYNSPALSIHDLYEDIGKLAIGRHLSRGGKVAAEQPERAFNCTRHKWDWLMKYSRAGWLFRKAGRRPRVGELPRRVRGNCTNEEILPGIDEGRRQNINLRPKGATFPTAPVFPIAPITPMQKWFYLFLKKVKLQ